MKHFREILVAKTPEEAVRLRREAGPRALYLAGGTMAVPLAARAVDVLVDVSRLDLATVISNGDAVSIGATARMCDLLTPDVKADLPLVYDALAECATPLVRNVATIGGGMAVVHLPSDIAVAMLASGAELEIIRGGASDAVTKVPAIDLLGQGWLKGADLVCRVNVPKPRPGEGVSFQKFGRSAIDIAIVNAAVRIRRSADGSIAELCAVVGQTNSLPVVLKGLEGDAAGKPVTRSLIEHLALSAAASVKAKQDFRASGEYRKHLVEVMVARALAEAAVKAGWNLEG